MSLARRIAALERLFVPPVQPVRYVLAAAPEGLSREEHREWKRRYDEYAAAQGWTTHTLNVEELPSREEGAADAEDDGWWTRPLRVELPF